MANNDSAVTITTDSVTNRLKTQGIYYFKLDPEHFLYPDDDEQRLCGLLGSEIDSNFHFLSGFDIKSVEFDESGSTIVISRVNDEDFSAITLDLKDVRPELRFDKEEGVLYMTYPDGEEKVAEGFFVDFNDEGKYDVKVYTDGTLDGLGTMYSPLSLSRLERTGMYSPVETLVDGPVTEEYVGKRVLTKELVEDYGRLYTYAELEAIQAALEASPWRVATKADWDEMLNAMEEEESREHDETSPGYKGNAAGGVLKSNRYWDTSSGTYANNEPHEYVGFDILPVGYAPAGRGAVMNADDLDIEDFGKNAGFWTRNEEEDEYAWVKIFGHGFDGVKQSKEETEDEGTLYSIRLVREYVPECAEQYETILGDSYPVGPIVGICDDYAKVWTLANFYGDGRGYQGVKIQGENVPEPDEYAYFINECDGKKKRMNEGDSVVILDKDVHEHRVIDGELVDMDKQFEDMVNDAKNELDNTISELSAATESAVTEINTSIDTLSANTDSTITAETARAMAEEEALNERVDVVSGNLNTFSAFTENKFTETDSAITANEDAINEVSSALTAETERAMAVESSLSGTIMANTSAISQLTEDLVEEIGEIEAKADANAEALGNKIDELSSSTIAVSNSLMETTDGLHALEDLVPVSISTAKAEAISDAKDYADEKINEVNAVKVNDLYYDDRLKYLRLVKADGSLSDGIPADEFLKDSVLTSVEYDEGNSRLIFVWNDDYTTRTYIPLERLSNVYGIGQDSLAYLKMSGTNISAIVDKGDGFEKTLATTKYVDDKTFELEEATTANTAAIEVLNGDKNVAGSVKHTIEDRFVSDILAGGPIITTTTLDDARYNSLMRVISVDGERKYFVSNDAKDMQATNASGSPVVLNAYINSLESRIATLEEENASLKEKANDLENRVSALESAGLDEAAIKNIIKNYLAGTDKEIKVAESGGTLQIGFADDAVFGWIM